MSDKKISEETAAAALGGTEKIPGVQGGGNVYLTPAQLLAYFIAIWLDTDTALAANSDLKIASQKAVKAYIDGIATGVLRFKGTTDCSGNPNYPSASKGDSYLVTVAGKIGGASGVSVDVGDVYAASANNAGGTQASVGASWFVLEHNLQGALLAANNLSDLGSAPAARTNLGLGSVDNTADSAKNVATAATLANARNFSIAGGGISAAAVSFNGSTVVVLNASVDAGHITLARMANLTANSILGNNTGSAATPVALTVAQVKTLLALAAADLANGVTGTGAVVLAAGTPEITGTLRLKATMPTMEFRDGGGARLGYFQHDGSDLYASCDVGSFVVRGIRSQFDNTDDLGTAAKRWRVIYAGTGTINTSDAREKRLIGQVPDAWLDAWGDVQWQRFKYNDGERWHVGLVAQQVRDAFAARGLDAREIGLLCFDEWGAVTAVRAKHDRKGNVTRAARAAAAAGDRWGLRYDECQAMEAAWMRRELGKLRAA